MSFYSRKKCLTFLVNSTVVKKSVRLIQFAWNSDSSTKLLLNLQHPFNTWPRMPITANNFQIVDTAAYDSTVLEYEILNFLGYKNQSCEFNKTYNFDECMEKYLNQRAMDEVGCTTKFAKDQSNVCPNGTEKEKDVNDQLKDILFKSDTQVCTFPCQLMHSKLRPNKLRVSTNKIFNIHANQYVKVTTFKYSYTALELLAEVGGYVGLFLGFSVFHLKDLFNSLLNCISKK